MVCYNGNAIAIVKFRNDSKNKYSILKKKMKMYLH